MRAIKIGRQAKGTVDAKLRSNTYSKVGLGMQLACQLGQKLLGSGYVQTAPKSKKINCQTSERKTK